MTEKKGDLIDGLLYYANRAPAWRCEISIRSTLDAFAAVRPECITANKSSLYAAAREVVAEVGEENAPKFIYWADAWVRKNSPELFIKTPRSYLFLLGKWKMHEAAGNKFEKLYNEIQEEHND